jgi:hypothetical protein
MNSVEQISPPASDEAASDAATAARPAAATVAAISAVPENKAKKIKSILRLSKTESKLAPSSSGAAKHNVVITEREKELTEPLLSPPPSVPSTSTAGHLPTLAQVMDYDLTKLVLRIPAPAKTEFATDTSSPSNGSSASEESETTF